MSTCKTTFGSLTNFNKGRIDVFNDNPKNYAFSNIFEVASLSKPYERIAVGKNFKYVIEAVYALGHSNWYASQHDEFVLVMDGKINIELIKLPDHIKASLPTEGATHFESTPNGNNMGSIFAKKGHMALLPKGAAYCFYTDSPAVLLLQTIEGPLTIQKWKEICFS